MGAAIIWGGTFLSSFQKLVQAGFGAYNIYTANYRPGISKGNSNSRFQFSFPDVCPHIQKLTSAQISSKLPSVPSLSRSEMFRHRRDEDKKNISNRIVYLKGHVEEVTEVLRWAKIVNRRELNNLVCTDKKINIDVAFSCTNERTDIRTKFSIYSEKFRI